jgi:predicted AlkP superfamily phosphohydrolase/phosphomutase
MTLATRIVLLTLVIVLATPETGWAYVGPGAGFAFVSSIFIIIFTTFLALLTLLTWPIRWAIQSIRGSQALAAARVKRVVVLGLDGQDPELTEQYMREGLLPNFSRLRDKGTFVPLQTTLLAESPVAWSSFQTGCNPGKHRIFDFLVPNRKSYLPELCSARVEPPKRTLPLGPFRVPLGKPRIQAGRRSQPFWKILGDHGIFSTVLRVPITFPAEKFNGVLLSAMSVPDLKGSQGTYYYFSNDAEEERTLAPKMTSGERIPLDVTDGVGRASIPGPDNSLKAEGGELHLPIEVRPDGDGALLTIGDEIYTLTRRKYTPWIQLGFKAAPGILVRGIVRFYLLETSPHIKLYMTPINIDPDKPALPISHPFTYAIYLSKTLGRYATLGLAEDTSSLNEDVVDEDAFLEQTYLIHEEREKMFFDAIDKTNRGAVVCVFDITDRLQHMFFRHLDENHPANRGRDNTTHRDAIRTLYQQMDDLVGRTMDKLDDDTVLMVMSDHGFKPFRRCVNLNSWLYKHGFLALKNGGPTGADMFQDVDWSKTRAYAVGFGGIYLNLTGREAQGIVPPGSEADRVKQEIMSGLRELYDEKEQTHPVREVYEATKVYSGPYVDEAPDLIVGFQPGHRVGWASVTGGVTEEEIEDNVRPWSGDHNFNPPDVPGMLFCNRTIAVAKPSIMDISATVLDLFGVKVPPYFDGASLMPATPRQTDAGEVAVPVPEPATRRAEASTS